MISYFAIQPLTMIPRENNNEYYSLSRLRSRYFGLHYKRLGIWTHRSRVDNADQGGGGQGQEQSVHLGQLFLLLPREAVFKLLKLHHIFFCPRVCLQAFSLSTNAGRLRHRYRNYKVPESIKVIFQTFFQIHIHHRVSSDQDLVK